MTLEQVIQILGKVTGKHFIVRRLDVQAHSTFKSIRKLIIEIWCRQQGVTLLETSVESTCTADIKEQTVQQMELDITQKILKAYVP